MRCDIPKELLEVCKDAMLTGSSIICDPPVLHNDIDIVLYVDNMVAVTTLLQELYWEPTLTNGYVGSNFTSLRKGKWNAILVEGRGHFAAWVFATKLATELNVTDKEDRVSLFNVIKKYLPTSLN